MSVALPLPKPVVQSFPTDADFSTSKYLAVKSTGADTDLQTDPSNAATGKTTGFLTANVRDYSALPAGARVDVVTEGGARVIAGAAIAFDVPVMVDATSRVVTASDGNWSCGYSKGTPGAAGDEFAIEINHFYYEVT